MKCVWCNGDQASPSTKICQWIQPSGSAVVTVTDVPAIHCPHCKDTYIEDDLNESIELALNTVEIELLGNQFTYDQLMKAPRLNIFELFKRGDRFSC